MTKTIRNADNPGPPITIQNMLALPKCKTYIKYIYAPLSLLNYSVVVDDSSDALIITVYFAGSWRDCMRFQKT